jgi:hypothetical protein
MLILRCIRKLLLLFAITVFSLSLQAQIIDELFQFRDLNIASKKVRYWKKATYEYRDGKIIMNESTLKSLPGKYSTRLELYYSGINKVDSIYEIIDDDLIKIIYHYNIDEKVDYVEKCCVSKSSTLCSKIIYEYNESGGYSLTDTSSVTHSRFSDFRDSRVITTITTRKYNSKGYIVSKIIKDNDRIKKFSYARDSHFLLEKEEVDIVFRKNQSKSQTIISYTYNSNGTTRKSVKSNYSIGDDGKRHQFLRSINKMTYSFQ